MFVYEANGYININKDGKPVGDPQIQVGFNAEGEPEILVNGVAVSAPSDEAGAEEDAPVDEGTEEEG